MSGTAVKRYTAVHLYRCTGHNRQWRGFDWYSAWKGVYRSERPYGGSGTAVNPSAPTGLPVGCTTGAPGAVTPMGGSGVASVRQQHKPHCKPLGGMTVRYLHLLRPASMFAFGVAQ